MRFWSFEVGSGAFVLLNKSDKKVSQPGDDADQILKDLVIISETK